jgi:hypothetical protein
MKKGAKSLMTWRLWSFVLPVESLEWWSRGELNPRPQAITGQFYMRSALI